jgi:hypothetical protein
MTHFWFTSYERRMTIHLRMNAEWIIFYLHGRLYRVAVTMENVGCLVVSAKSSLNHHSVLSWSLGPQLHFSMETCVNFVATLCFPKESYLRGKVFTNSFPRNGLHVTISITWCPVLLLIKQSHLYHPWQLRHWKTSSKAPGKWVIRMRHKGYSTQGVSLFSGILRWFSGQQSEACEHSNKATISSSPLKNLTLLLMLLIVQM